MLLFNKRKNYYYRVVRLYMGETTPLPAKEPTSSHELVNHNKHEHPPARIIRRLVQHCAPNSQPQRAYCKLAGRKSIFSFSRSLNDFTHLLCTFYYKCKINHSKYILRNLCSNLIKNAYKFY